MHGERPAWATTHVGRVRPLNEDVCLVGGWRSRKANDNWRGVLSTSRAWAVIADGMGGHEAGNVASRVVIDAIADLIKDASSEASISAMLETANRRLFEAMYESGGRPGMGTTVVGAVISEREAFIFNVGDSRAYVLRGGELFQLSHDDTLNVRRGTLRHRSYALTQSLGGSTKPRVLQPHYRRISLEDHDTLLLCSDGITDMIEEDEIAGILVRHSEDPAQQLIAAALDAGGEDNITAVVVGPIR